MDEKHTLASDEVERSNVIFKVGDIVTCPSEFGNDKLNVVQVIPIANETDRRLALHSQWVIAERQGVRLPSKSGYHFVKDKS